MKRNLTTAVAGIVLAIGFAAITHAAEPGLVKNADFASRQGNAPADYTLSGDISYQYLGDPRVDASTYGAALHARGTGTAAVSQIVAIPAGKDRAYRFDIRALAQEGYSLNKGGHLWLRIDFLGNGTKTYDWKGQDLYSMIEQSRHDLNVNGDHHTGGAAVWRTYSLAFIVPFEEITRLKLSVVEESAHATQSKGDFYVSQFDLTPIDRSAVTAEALPDASAGRASVALDHILPIGGRWFYAARPDESTVPTEFNDQNADRLLYNDGHYETPFAGNMSSTLRAGEKDMNGHIVTHDTFIPDSVTVRFDQTSMIIHTHDLPNHPTGKFPQTGNGLFGNPNYITEQDYTFYIPLNPKERANHTVTDRTNSNHALNMGPIGIATNGVVFFNPFDATSMDATNFMDACCGHPNFDGLYHYHKYPICINTPWSDAGQAHSPLLGWAFDGFPIYGPYESKDQMAESLTGANKLNGFNMHYDADRGWHYHVTPGEFPYLIGGYWGTVDSRDLQRPHHTPGSNPGGRPGMNGQGMGGPGMGGAGMDGPPRGRRPYRN